MCVCVRAILQLFKLLGLCFEGIANLKLAVDNHHPFDLLFPDYELTMGLICFP